MKSRIYQKMVENNIDTSRVTLFYNDQQYGAIQDPGPIFLKNVKGEFALADFKFIHPDKRTELIDRNVAAQLGLPRRKIAQIDCMPLHHDGGEYIVIREINRKGNYDCEVHPCYPDSCRDR